MCQYAHSIEELDEWKERWQWRKMKREIAKQKGMYSYMDDLQEEYENADSGVNVVSILLFVLLTFSLDNLYRPSCGQVDLNPDDFSDKMLGLPAVPDSRSTKFSPHLLDSSTQKLSTL